ncbi:hypothetical protein [Demequina sp. NBRC 110054]|uniref:hypothetical protein n=1 Tax=Demequina sp. NBRC 110054 TaxID=1570343 RepID=UPI0011776A26|nr:hypothetical protein [Demequina sp. NBRC 110054]
MTAGKTRARRGGRRTGSDGGGNRAKASERRATRVRVSRKLKRIQSDDRNDLKPLHLDNIDMGLSHNDVAAQIRVWQFGSGTATPGPGKPESLSLYSFLILWSAVTEDGSPAPIRDVAHAMRYRLTQESAEKLGITDDVYLLTDGRTFWDVKNTDEEETVTFEVSPDALYGRAHSAYTRLMKLVEPYPRVATQHARAIMDVEADVEALESSGFADNMRARMLWLMNAIVHGSLFRFNRAQRRVLLRHWRGSVAIDGTNVPAYAAKFTGGVRKEFRGIRSRKRHHAEAMAGWYVRTGDHGGLTDDGTAPVSDAALKKALWAYEATIAVTVDDANADDAQRVPCLVFGISFDAPAFRIGENSLTALEALAKVASNHDISPGSVVADRAIMPNAKPEKFKEPARKMGFKSCHDYTVNQLGKMAGPIGTIMVEGRLRCPGMPEAQIDATKNFRARQEADAEEPIPEEQSDDAESAEPDGTYRQQLDRRAMFNIKTDGPANRDGEIRISCPATDPHGNVRCPLRELVVSKIENRAQKAKFEAIMNDGRTRVDVENPPDEAVAGEICLAHQASHKVKLDEVTGKYHQDYEYKSPEWQRMYGKREHVETFNKDVKEDGLDDTKRRRGRGMAKQAIATALFFALTNVKRIRAYLNVHRIEHGPIPTDPGPTPLKRRYSDTTTSDEDLAPPNQVAA